MTLGIEVGDGVVTAVAASDRGAVEARSRQAGSGAESAADAVRALARVGMARVGAAVRDPRDPASTDIAVAAGNVVRAQSPPRVIGRGTAIALAEQWCGAASGADNVVAVVMSESVHAGIVIGGRPFEGAHGSAGAAGWLALNPVEREDYRKLGCLEAEIGAPGIVRRLVWRLKAGDESSVLESVGGEMTAITVSQIFDAARQGDGVAISIVRDTVRYLGMAIGNIVAVLDPDVVVLGGVILAAPDLFLEPCRVEAVRRMPARVAGSIRIVPAVLGDDAGALGAARAAMLA